MLAQKAYLWARNFRVERFLAQAKRARQIQQQVLLQKLRRNEDSAYGRDHGLKQVRSIADFRKQPITTYEDYRPYIERVKQGETSAMFGPGAKLLMFALTSGTTDRSKFIPITKEFLEEYRRGWNLWGVKAYVDHAPLVGLFNLQLTSDWRQFYTEGGIPCGNISGLASDTAPLVSRPLFLFPKALMKVSDPAAKQYAALRIALATGDVGVIMTANPSTLVEFARLAEIESESLIRDIRDGSLRHDPAITSEIRAAISRRVSKPNPKRARELEQIIERTGKLLPRDFWPRMQLLAVWTGGSVGAYLPRLKEYYGPTSIRDHGLSASEGRITIPFRNGSSAGVLDYDTQYFEFIPEDEHDRPQPTILEAHELEPGRNYFVLLTTSSGFYRYDIHDVVRCVGYEGEAPILEFLNKGANFSSITGEKISESQVATSVRSAFEALDLPIDTFTVAPKWGETPGYVLVLEQGIERRLHAELLRRIDAELGRQNCEYANRLETKRLRPLAIQELESGSWSLFRRKRIERLGGSLEQYKHPCLVSDLQFLPNLLRLETENRQPAVAGA